MAAPDFKPSADEWVKENATALQWVAVLMVSLPWFLVVAHGLMWLFALPAFFIPAAALFLWTIRPEPPEETDADN